jgi:hypothetical protein
MNDYELLHIDEPKLLFANQQTAIDPRDGLMLFGPYQKLSPYSVIAGVVSTSKGLSKYKKYVDTVNGPILSTKTTYGTTHTDEVSRPSFPGFESIFNVKWDNESQTHCRINEKALDSILSERNKKVRINKLVNLYLSHIRRVENTEDVDINIWFVIVPRRLFIKSRPGSKGIDNISAGTKDYIEKNKAGQIPISFDEYEDYDEIVTRLKSSKNNFHHLLKARLIQENIRTPIQIMVEPTLEFKDKYSLNSYDKNIKAHVAWTLSTTLFYKLGKLPWKLSGIREGVCYVGLVFKKFAGKEMACSAAQMFLNDGDGSVFRGNIGLWGAKSKYEYHLDKRSAEELLGMALDDYKLKKGFYPNELFIHGKAYFNYEEWEGFKKAVNTRGANTKITGVVIRQYNDLKLFRDVKEKSSNYGILRGTALIVDENEAFLFTNGYVPRLKTATSLEVPNPLRISIYRGNVDIKTVLTDIMGLTKLNYNACIYGDGLPVTLKFSDNIGNILTATDNWKSDIRQFKYYI